LFDSEVAFTTADHGHRIRSNQLLRIGCRKNSSEIDQGAAHRAMMPHCRLGAMSVSQTRFLDHVDKGPGYYGTFFNAILMTLLRRQDEDLKHVMAAWDCLVPGGTLAAVVSPGWEHPANETELLLFQRWFATVHGRQEEPSENHLSPHRRCNRGSSVQ
jgi:hypothetical protein